jgi:uncharacterized protein (TIGR02145 family)
MKFQILIVIIFSFCITIELVAQGNVGIGTLTPVNKLTVNADGQGISHESTDGLTRIGTWSHNTSGAYIQTHSNHALNFATNNGLAQMTLTTNGSVGIGTTNPNASAIAELKSTTKGFLPPRMNMLQRDAIATPAEGLIVSCTDCSIKGLHQYINGAWQAMTSSNTGNYGTVVNPVTGKVWLDRNLGAAQVAVSSIDAASYGDLYQWGRNADGHQIRSSTTTINLASNFFTTNGMFIIINSSPNNWLTNVETHMWSGTAAENNPCPSGFRVPTAAEWEQERRTWSSNDADGAFASPLKLPMAGFRFRNDGSLDDVGSFGDYWSSTFTTINNNARHLVFNSSAAIMNTFNCAYGLSVRCIKD